jgi:hypothetical protein
MANTQDDAQNLSQEREQISVTLANNFISNATLGEALMQVPLNNVIELVQKKALEQAKTKVEEMDDDQIRQIIVNAQEAQQAQQNSEVSEEQKETASV